MIERIRAGLGRIRSGIRPTWIGHRKLVIAVGAIAIVAIVGTGLLVWLGPLQGSAASGPSPSPSASLIASASPSASPTESPTPSPSPTVDLNPTPIPSGWEYSDLDGVAAPADLAHRLPLAVMIDDNSPARPQSGFSSASIVYQAPADGGETRYMLVFQEATASDIGPARSARPYYVYWAAEYKALFGHIGGDAMSLQQVVPAMARYIYNMDELNSGSCPWRRITSGTAGTYTASQRVSPHNDYTRSSELIRCAAKRAYPTAYQKLPTRTFVDDQPLADRPAAQSITIPYRNVQIGYTYDPASNAYLRSVSGKLQIDPANSQQVLARNVVVMFQAWAMLPSVDAIRPFVTNVGSGQAIVFKEGQAIKGTWKKTSNTALTRLYDASGAEIPLVRGSIFMQSVPIGTAVTYK